MAALNLNYSFLKGTRKVKYEDYMLLQEDLMKAWVQRPSNITIKSVNASPIFLYRKKRLLRRFSQNMK